MLPERRHEVSRLEAFSDAAFALTLLVVRLEVPTSYDELMGFLSLFSLVVRKPRGEASAGARRL